MPPVDARALAAVFAGGFLGTIARAALVEVAPPTPGRWPWATFAVNVLGAFLIGYFLTNARMRRPLSACRRPLLGTGFCGALTTFATMQVELLEMLDRGHIVLAVSYAATSVAAGLLAVALATRLVGRTGVAV